MVVCVIDKLAGEPGCQVTPAVYPHLDNFTGKLNFRDKSQLIQFRILKPGYKHSRGTLPDSPIKIWGKSVKGFLSYDRKNKQTNIDYNFIYRYTQYIFMNHGTI